MADAPTRDELAEKLGHLCANARRLDGTAYYGREHDRINAALDEWEAAEATPSLSPTP